MKKLPLNLKIYILIIYLITFISFLVFFKIEQITFFSIDDRITVVRESRCSDARALNVALEHGTASTSRSCRSGASGCPRCSTTCSPTPHAHRGRRVLAGIGAVARSRHELRGRPPGRPRHGAAAAGGRRGRRRLRRVARRVGRARPGAAAHPHGRAGRGRRTGPATPRRGRRRGSPTTGTPSSSSASSSTGTPPRPATTVRGRRQPRHAAGSRAAAHRRVAGLGAARGGRAGAGGRAPAPRPPRAGRLDRRRHLRRPLRLGARAGLDVRGHQHRHRRGAGQHGGPGAAGGDAAAPAHRRTASPSVLRADGVAVAQPLVVDLDGVVLSAGARFTPPTPTPSCSSPACRPATPCASASARSLRPPRRWWPCAPRRPSRCVGSTRATTPCSPRPTSACGPDRAGRSVVLVPDAVITSRTAYAEPERAHRCHGVVALRRSAPDRPRRPTTAATGCARRARGDRRAEPADRRRPRGPDRTVRAGARARRAGRRRHPRVAAAPALGRRHRRARRPARRPVGRHLLRALARRRPRAARPARRRRPA